MKGVGACACVRVCARYHDSGIQVQAPMAGISLAPVKLRGLSERNEVLELKRRKNIEPAKILARIALP